VCSLQQEVSGSEEEQRFEEMREAGLDPCFFIDNNRDKDGEENYVTNGREGKIVDGTFMKMSKRNGANREKKQVREKKR